MFDKFKIYHIKQSNLYIVFPFFLGNYFDLV